MLDESFFSRQADAVAPDLLGRELVCGNRRGIIVETEAYREDDPASHSYRGRTERNASMYLHGGHVYVYRIYGIHRCFNVVTGSFGDGQAVLIRACEPRSGIPAMWRDRYGEEMPQELEGKAENRRFRNLCSGPGKITAAFGIRKAEHDGIRIGGGPISILPGSAVSPSRVSCGPRIGLGPGKGGTTLWRWYITENRFVSR